ncbi:TonB-dependent receptor [Novosphingobium lindaniclasticum]
MHLTTRHRRAGELCLLATTILTPFALPATAMAQEAGAPQASEQTTAPSSGLTDIVVTATRTSESVQRVPISIQALAPEKLDQRQVANFADYANILPSVSFATLGPGRSEPFFRGISVSGGALPTVGVYLDEIPLTTAGRMPDLHIYDIERIEALSGPQGTLFGASSLAGTLRIITQKPKLGEFEAGYDAQINKYGAGDPGAQLEGFMNLPVTENIAIRLMGYYRHDGGYIDNTPGSYNFKLGDDDPDTNYLLTNDDLVKKNYNPVTDWGGRATVSVDLGDDWLIMPSITYQNLNAKGSFNYDPDVGDLKVHDYSETYNKDKWYQAALTIQGHLGDFDLVSSTGYFKRRIKNANDYTYYSVTYDNFGPGYESYLQFKDADGNFQNPAQAYFGNQRQSKFTQELRLSVPKSWPFTLTAGAFYQYQKQKTDSDYYIRDLGYLSTLPINAGSSHAVKRDAFYLVETNTVYKDFALFAEGTYEIVPNLKVTGGIRYFDTKNSNYGFGGVEASARSSRAYNTLTGEQGCDVPLPDERLTCINTDIKYSEKGETHKLSLAWQATPDKMLYATYSTGFRPGGGNRIAPTQPYKADTLTNWEMGFKTTWGNNFRLNGAVYYEQWKGVQYLVVPFGFQGAGLRLNAGDARVYGVEMDAEWKIGDLMLSAAGAYNDAALAENFCKITRDSPTSDYYQLASCPDVGQQAAAKGTRLPRQPKFKTNATARYSFMVSDFDAFVQAAAFYQTSSTSDLDTYNNSLLGNTKGFESFDFSAGFKKDNWSVEAFIQNAFDKRGALSKNTFCSIAYCSDSSRTYPIKPRFFGLKFGQRF